MPLRCSTTAVSASQAPAATSASATSFSLDELDLSTGTDGETVENWNEPITVSAYI